MDQVAGDQTMRQRIAFGGRERERRVGARRIDCLVAQIRGYFESTIDLPSKIGMNRIIFAFRDKLSSLNGAALLQTGRDLDQTHPISFSTLAKEILDGAKSPDIRSVGDIEGSFHGSQSLSIASL